MKKKEIYEGTVERIDFPDKGTVTVDGVRVSVKGVLKGQVIRFVIEKARADRAEGRLLKLIKEAPEETESPVCDKFGECGGCSLQRLPYEKQTELKEEEVKKLLDKVAENEFEFEGVIESPQKTGYRNKMEFSFGDEQKGGPLTLGLHKKGSIYDVTCTLSCKLVHEDYSQIVKAIFDLCNTYKLSYFHKISHIGYLRHLVIRRAEHTGGILVHFVTSSQLLTRDMEPFDEAEFLSRMTGELLALRLTGKIEGILHSVNDSLADAVKSDETIVLYGKDYIVEKILGLSFKISSYSFFQTNSKGAELLYGKVREYVGEISGKNVFDLYSGTGTIAQMLAAVAERVTGVEIVEEAVCAAKSNAEINGLANCSFISGDVFKVLASLEERPDLIILDPPREGINPKALKKIVDYGVDRMVYVSCKPTSLAKDLIYLQQNGYCLKKVCCVDLFPMTVNIETVCLLSRKV